jgi:hypothetical protein
MKDQDINIATSGACPGLFQLRKSGWHHRITHLGATGWVRCVKGNIFDDLNAMHEAWKTLGQTGHNRFRNDLQAIVQRDGVIPGTECRSVCNATARQRSEAFLRVKGLWKE